MLDHPQLAADVAVEIARFVVVPIETQPHYRVSDRPVPVVVDVETSEQRLVALEKLPQGIDQETLAESAWPGQEVIPPLGDKSPDKGGLVDIVEILFPNRAEILDADRELAAGH